MSDYVQAYDPDHGVYRLIEVKTGDFVGEQEYLFDGVDEVDPLEGKGAKQPQRYDPLGGFR